jgi:type II secretory pathway component PulC
MEKFLTKMGIWIAILSVLFVAGSVGVAGPSEKIVGYKLLYIEKGSIYEKLGLMSGDTIHGINGKPISSNANLNELGEALKASHQVEIEIYRKGSRQILSYKIKK